jgi:hypothetical protein
MVIYDENGSKIPWKSQEHQYVIFKLVSSMPDLVGFCFITTSEIQPETVAKLKQKFYELIIPIRPTFWCHVDKYLPRATDIPQSHEFIMIRLYALLNIWLEFWSYTSNVFIIIISRLKMNQKVLKMLPAAARRRRRVLRRKTSRFGLFQQTATPPKKRLWVEFFGFASKLSNSCIL